MLMNQFNSFRIDLNLEIKDWLIKYRFISNFYKNKKTFVLFKNIITVSRKILDYKQLKFVICTFFYFI